MRALPLPQLCRQCSFRSGRCKNRFWRASRNLKDIEHCFPENGPDHVKVSLSSFSWFHAAFIALSKWHPAQSYSRSQSLKFTTLALIQTHSFSPESKSGEAISFLSRLSRSVRHIKSSRPCYRQCERAAQIEKSEGDLKEPAGTGKMSRFGVRITYRQDVCHLLESWAATACPYGECFCEKERDDCRPSAGGIFCLYLNMVYKI